MVSGPIIIEGHSGLFGICEELGVILPVSGSLCIVRKLVYCQEYLGQESSYMGVIPATNAEW